MPYESKPMKKQWIEVDGKMTPIILPQIWSHEKQDWVVTSEQNPLPTQVTGSKVDNLEVIKDINRTFEDEETLVSDVFDNTGGRFTNFFLLIYSAHPNNVDIRIQSSIDTSFSWRKILLDEKLDERIDATKNRQIISGFNIPPYYIRFEISKKNNGSSLVIYNLIGVFY